MKKISYAIPEYVLAKDIKRIRDNLKMAKLFFDYTSNQPPIDGKMMICKNK